MDELRSIISRYQSVEHIDLLMAVIQNLESGHTTDKVIIMNVFKELGFNLQEEQTSHVIEYLCQKECPICFRKLSKLPSYACGHFVCGICMNQMRMLKMVLCPICREKVI